MARASATPAGGIARLRAGRGLCDADVVARRRQRTIVERVALRVTRADVRGPGVRGPTAMAPVAVGALAIGAVAVGRLAIGRASIKRLTIEELEVRRLKVTELEVAASGARRSELTAQADGTLVPRPSRSRESGGPRGPAIGELAVSACGARGPFAADAVR